MSHYFTNDEHMKSDEKSFQVDVLGGRLKFITDIGVFSKGELDDASRLLVETVDKMDLGTDVLDVGCGYGAIGVALATVRPDVNFQLIDVNLRALDLARRNAELNQVDNVLVLESNLYQSVDKKDFTTVLSNPPIRAGKKVVHGVLTGAFDHLAPGGQLVIVIGKQHGAASAMTKMEETFGNVERVDRKKGFWILRSIKTA